MSGTQFGFGSGCVWTTPQSDVYGTAIAAAAQTPLLLGVLQDISVDFSGDVKELYGQLMMPVALGGGKMKITGKAKWAQVNMQTIAGLFFGQAYTSATLSDVYDTVGAVIPDTPFTITPTVPSTGTWSVDLGVRDVYGNNFTRVASAPTTGQYSVTAGAYLFATADTGKTVFISFQYTATSTANKTATFLNTPMGNKPVFRCDFFNGFQSNALSLTLFQCIATKFSMATKIDDFISQELDFSSFADGAGRVVQIGTGQ